MAKKKEKRKSAQATKLQPADPLKSARDAFEAGDYVTTRKVINNVGDGAEAGKVDTSSGPLLISAMRVDRMTVLVGLGCIGLFLLVLLTASLKMP